MKRITFIAAIIFVVSRICPAATINLLPKIYGPGQINFQPGNEYVGVKGQTIFDFPEQSNGYGLAIAFDNFTLKNVKVVGGGILVNKPSGMSAGINIDNCDFFLNAAKNAVGAPGGLRNSSIANCSFTATRGAFAIYVQNYDGLTVANNDFDILGAHIQAYNGSKNLLAEQNYFHNITSMGFEFQTIDDQPNPVTGVIVQDNWYEKPRLVDSAGHVVANKNSFALSLPLTRAEHPITRRNVVYAGLKPTDADKAAGKYVRCNFELGGSNVEAKDNFSDGGNDACAVNGSQASGEVSGNLFRGSDHVTGNNTKNGAHTNFHDNAGPLSAEMQRRINAQDKPGPNKRYGQAPPPPPPPTDDPAQLKAQIVALTVERDALKASGAAGDAMVAALSKQISDLQAAIRAEGDRVKALGN